MLTFSNVHGIITSFSNFITSSKPSLRWTWLWTARTTHWSAFGTSEVVCCFRTPTSGSTQKTTKKNLGTLSQNTTTDSTQQHYATLRNTSGTFPDQFGRFWQHCFCHSCFLNYWKAFLVTIKRASQEVTNFEQFLKTRVLERFNYTLTFFVSCVTKYYYLKTNIQNIIYKKKTNQATPSIQHFSNYSIPFFTNSFILLQWNKHTPPRLIIIFAKIWSIWITITIFIYNNNNIW